MHMRHLLAPLAALAIALPLFAHAAEPEAVFKLEPYRKTVALRATVAGHEGLFAFDTAGGQSLVTPKFAARAGLKTWGVTTGYMMHGDRLDTPKIDNLDFVIGGKKFTARASGTFDLMSLYPKDAEPVDGLIALDVFDHKAITIDFRSRTLTVESPASLRERVAGATEVPVMIGRESQGRSLSASLGVPTANGLVWLEIDSGNGGTILVNRMYAALFGLDPQSKSPQKIRFDVAKGLTASSEMGFASDIILDGNIGMPFLKDVALTLDVDAGRLWIRR